MVFGLIGALRSIFGRQPKANDLASLREAISVEVDDDFYPTSGDVASRLRETGAFKAEAISWIAAEICQGSRDGNGYRATEINVRRQGNPLSTEQKKVLGLRSNYRIGDRFAEACQINPRDAGHQVFLVAQAASHQAVLRNNRRRWKEAGITHVRLRPCNDERDCDIARRRSGERMTVDEAHLPLPGCNVEYCRCIFSAEVKFDEGVL